MLTYLPQIAKAIAGGAAAFGAAFAAAYTDQQVSTSEWVAIGVSTVVAAATVWAIPNKPAQP